MHSTQPARVPAQRGGGRRPRLDEEDAGFVRDLVEGFTYMLRNRDLRLILVLTCAQTVVAGASAVFVVSVAFDLVDLGPQGVGYLESALGLGALLGGFIAISRATANRLGGDFAVGVILWSLPLVLVAVWPSAGVALLVMALLGVANPLVDVNLDTMLQRLTPDRLLARVFGTLESAFIAFMALGAGLMPLLMQLFGIRWALGGLGLAITLVVLPALPRLHRLDERLLAPTGLPLLKAIPMFAPIAAPTLETLARQLTTHQVSAGSPVFLEGEVGDAFYVIESGEVRACAHGRPPAYRGGRRLLRRDRPPPRRAPHRGRGGSRRHGAAPPRPHRVPRRHHR